MRLISASCICFRQYLTNALLESGERETKVCGLDRVSNPGPLVLESNALPTALRGPDLRQEKHVQEKTC